MPRGTRSPIWRYGLAILVTLAAILLTEATPLSIGAPYLLLLPAVAISTWYGGWGPGLVVTAIGAIDRLYRFEPPIGSLAPTSPDSIIRIGLFLASATIVIVITSERDRARQMAQTQAEHQAALAELSQRALQSTDLREVLDQVPNLLAQILGAECSYIAESLPEGSGLLVIAGAGWEDGTVGRARLPGSMDSEAGYTLLTREPVVSSDLRTEKRFSPSPLLLDHGLTSALTVMIFGSTKPYGILGAFTNRRRTFSAQDSRFLQAMANILAAAIQREQAQFQLRRLNADLEKRVTERTAELETANAGLKKEVAAREQVEAQVKHLYHDLEKRADDLEDANKELEAFSYSVSHDLRNPLATIDQFSQLLLEDYGAQLPEEGQRFMRLIREGAAAMDRLIQDLLSLSRTTRKPLKKELVHPDEMVRQVVEELYPLQAGRDVQVVIGDLPACTADPILLKQVWVNLLTNAYKFTRLRERAAIQIDSTMENGKVAYFVKDNGVGFDSKNAERLFSVFQRYHSDEDYEGTGIGLAIVERVIRRHGGHVWAQAEEDRGATFYFTVE